MVMVGGKGSNERTRPLSMYNFFGFASSSSSATADAETDSATAQTSPKATRFNANDDNEIPADPEKRFIIKADKIQQKRTSMLTSASLSNWFGGETSKNRPKSGVDWSKGTRSSVIIGTDHIEDEVSLLEGEALEATFTALLVT
jgi:hypothetical protein